MGKTKTLTMNTLQFAGEELSTPAVRVSADAERYARSHRLWGSFVIVKSLVLRAQGLAASIDVNLLRDPDATDQLTICFTVHTNAPVAAVLEFDERLRRWIFDEVPADDEIHFAIQFDFD